MEKKKIIIFGATGNVGSYLTLYALSFFDKEKYEIIASGRRKTDFWPRQGVKYYSVDLTKEEDFENTGIVPAGVPSIYKISAIDYIITVYNNERVKK